MWMQYKRPFRFEQLNLNAMQAFPQFQFNLIVLGLSLSLGENMLSSDSFNTTTEQI